MATIAGPMTSERTAGSRARELSHNLLGQRLGRKGLETRERILQAALGLLDTPPHDAPITLSAVARKASIGITTLYLYFPDLGDLMLAALCRVMETADDAFADRLRVRWPDDGLEACALDFLRAHLRFWRRHARILHLRNSFADAGDARFMEYRNRISFPLLGLLAGQMGDSEPRDTLLATVLLTGFERLATVITAAGFRESIQDKGFEDEARHVDRMLQVEARLIALGIGDARASSD